MTNLLKVNSRQMIAHKTRLAEAIAHCTAGPIRVTYRDTDRMGYAYHSQYLVWFEIGRTELLRSFGTAYRDWEEKEGVYLPVRSATVDYKSPAHYDDLVIIHTELTRLTKASISFSYHIHKDGSSELLATGSTTHAFVNSAGKVIRAADRLLPMLFR
jgi:acyl-CoA thioester hydrolase